jgi:hypothetical protein
MGQHDRNQSFSTAPLTLIILIICLLAMKFSRPWRAGIKGQGTPAHNLKVTRAGVRHDI